MNLCQALSERLLGLDNQETAEAIGTLALLQKAFGDPESAVTNFRKSIRLITPLVFATKLPVIVMTDDSSEDTTVGDAEISAAHFNDIDSNANAGANASK